MAGLGGIGSSKKLGKQRKQQEAQVAQEEGERVVVDTEKDASGNTSDQAS